jgi:hypothetical protein
MYVTLWASPFQMNWRAQVQYPRSGAGEVPPLLVPLKISGSSGCLGRKLVIAQDAAQSLADLRMQRLCPFTNRRDRRTSNQSVKRQKRPASTRGWYNDTHWLERPPPHSLGSLVASLLRASPGALPWVTRTEKKKRRGMEGTLVNLKLLPCGGSLRARTWTSSGSGIGRDWIRYSICLAFTMRSSTSSFLFAVRFGWSEKEMEYV